MLERLADQWQNLKNGLWLFPGLIAFVLAALALILLAVDRAFATEEAALLFRGDASAARGILSTVAGSLITVAGLTFSLTVVVLQLASSQYSPRVLRNFLGDRITQLTAGVYVGTFVYCLLVLREIRAGQDGTAFIPSLSVTVAIVLAVLALGLLLVFINNIAKLVQVEHITERINAALADAIGRESEGAESQAAEDDDSLRRARGEGEPEYVPPVRSGYVQGVYLDRAVRKLESGEWRIEALVAPGDFVAAHDAVARIWGEGDTGGRGRAAVHSAFNVTAQRDVHDDPAFAIRQLADIAIRAISPALNDPTTAVTCVSYLRAGLVALARQEPPPQVRRFDGGRIVFALRHPTLVDYAAPLLEVARHAARVPRVAENALVALADVVDAARGARRDEEADALAARARELADVVLDAVETESKRGELERVARRLG